ncbi:MAG: DUF4954 family protein [Bacteroidales bacterium]
MTIYRPLSHIEIQKLQQQCCTSDDWHQIQVISDFSPEHLNQVHFSGEIRLGRFSKSYTLEGGVKRHSGIYRASIHNCQIGNDVLIENVTGYLANCHIENEVRIIGVHCILTEGKSRFGNNTQAHVLNETGGREVAIYNGLSSQIAYIMAMYRHRKELISQLEKLISEYADQHAASYTTIGTKTKIYNCGTLRNVCIGSYARLYGVTSLENGTVNSNEHAHTRVGNGVIARDFIFASGAIVTDGAQITRSFIGQASHIGHLFSAHDSLLFSNCQMENGEACAIFAGPYSVSMHKSSLLIAAMYSFLNAGSGFNQSNHMYKLGPIHQGIIERGGRMASDSYILWPAKIGPFTMVMGRHMTHLDTSDLPFSYLIQVGTDSYIMPGANLQRVGTVRDSYKWPERDKRTDPNKLDLINFDLLSPYTMSKMLRAIEILQKIKEESPRDALRYTFQGAVIKRSSLEKGIKLYEKAIRRYLGNTLIKRITHCDSRSLTELRECLLRHSDKGLGEWSDLSGFLVPKKELDEVLRRIEAGLITDIDSVQLALIELQNNYAEMEWNWNSRLIESWYNINLATVTAGELQNILDFWHEAIIGFDEKLLEDAAKEFQHSSRIGFGIDDPESRMADFEAVRGTYDEQTFVRQIKEHIDKKEKLYLEIKDRIITLL